MIVLHIRRRCVVAKKKLRARYLSSRRRQHRGNARARARPAHSGVLASSGRAAAAAATAKCTPAVGRPSRPSSRARPPSVRSFRRHRRPPLKRQHKLLSAPRIIAYYSVSISTSATASRSTTVRKVMVAAPPSGHVVTVVPVVVVVADAVL